VATSATYSGPITVCILHTGLSAPSLWHASGTWNQVTPATDDGTTICGSVTSLSPFALLLNTGGQPPTADAGGPYSVDEGGSVTLTGSGTDPGGEPLSLAWDIEGDGSFETAGQAVNFSAVAIDGPATRTVQLQVTNTFGLKAEDAATGLGGQRGPYRGQHRASRRTGADWRHLFGLGALHGPCARRYPRR
jgi:hypothetical protein